MSDIQITAATWLALVAERDQLRAEIDRLKQELNHAQREIDFANNQTELHINDTKVVVQQRDDLRQQLTDANTEIERLKLELSEPPLNAIKHRNFMIAELRKQLNAYESANEIITTKNGKVWVNAEKHQAVCDKHCAEVEQLRRQRDQVLHLLQRGESLTEEDVVNSGLGVGVLIEKCHHEAMRCKAEQQLTAAQADAERLAERLLVMRVYNKTCTVGFTKAVCVCCDCKALAAHDALVKGASK